MTLLLSLMLSFVVSFAVSWYMQREDQGTELAITNPFKE